MKLSTSLVAVKKITSKVDRPQFLDTDLNQAAKLILEAEGVINPIILHRTSLESYEVVDGDFEYYAAVRAREIDPRKGEMIAAFIVEPENEEVIKEQIKIIRKQGSKDDYKPKGNNPSQENVKSYTDVEQAAAEAETEQLVDSLVLDDNESVISSIQPSSNQTIEIANISKNLNDLLNTLKSVNNKIEKLELGQQEILNRVPPPPDSINLNTIKTAKELEQQRIPQLGQKRAEAIIRLRQQKGQFQSISELIEVRGITQKMITKFASYLVCK